MKLNYKISLIQTDLNQSSTNVKSFQNDIADLKNKSKYLEINMKKNVLECRLKASKKLISNDFKTIPGHGKN